jgi:putative GTP pyrophosphokinase
MKSTNFDYSKTRIDRAGELLKSKSGSEDDTAKALDILSSWRAYHAIPLNVFAKLLRQRIQRINDRAVVAQRLK